MKRTFLSLLMLGMVLSGFSVNPPVNGWYKIIDMSMEKHEDKPIVTVVDFEAVRLDSAFNADGVMQYMILGKMKADKFNIWKEKTAEYVGQHIGFVYKGDIITAPMVQSSIPNGHFFISPVEFCTDRVRMTTLVEALMEELVSSVSPEINRSKG